MSGHRAGMTSTRGLDRLTLRSPSALVSAVPYLLGFHPTRSAVLVWLERGALVLTQRLDLPPVDGSSDVSWLRAVWGHAAAPRADELVVVTFDEALPDPLLGSLLATCQEAGVAMRDVLTVRQGRWRSLLCTDPACCPEQGREADPSVRDAVAAEFALTGCAPLASREALVEGLASTVVPAVRQAVEEAVSVARDAQRSAGSGERESWRDQRIADALVLLDGQAEGSSHRTPPAELVASVIVGLADVRVRDTVLWEAADWSQERLVLATSVLAPAVRAAPAGRVAPVATCFAALAWLAGDGARAATALDRAATDDPDYSLAALLRQSIGAGLPPSAWRAAMSDLTREDCRHGVGGVGQG